jgi:hypothetical protein
MQKRLRIVNYAVNGIGTGHVTRLIAIRLNRVRNGFVNISPTHFRRVHKSIRLEVAPECPLPELIEHCRYDQFVALPVAGAEA